MKEGEGLILSFGILELQSLFVEMIPNGGKWGGLGGNQRMKNPRAVYTKADGGRGGGADKQIFQSKPG